MSFGHWLSQDYVRDSPALPPGGLGLDELVHLDAEGEKLDSKVIGDGRIPLVAPLRLTLSVLDEGLQAMADYLVAKLVQLNAVLSLELC